MTRRVRRWARPVVLGGLLMVGVGACGEEVPEPVRVARAYAEAVRYQDVEDILPLVDSQTVARLEQAAERASDQVGGRRSIEPVEMVQVVDVDPRFYVDTKASELVHDDGTNAVVELTGTDGSKHRIELVNEDGAWKVRLPLPRGPMGEP